MITRKINIEISEMPDTCFNCPFSIKKYCWATCIFLKCTREDGDKTPSKCPLKLKNKNFIWHPNETKFIIED